jgi:hypothetical protein
LAKYATEFIHRWPSFICDGISGKKSFHHNIIRGPFLFQNLIWTRMMPDFEFFRPLSILLGVLIKFAGYSKKAENILVGMVNLGLNKDKNWRI